MSEKNKVPKMINPPPPPLKQNFENAVDKYIDAFCKKQEIDKTDAHWIGDQVGGLFDCCDCTFDFLDIIIDIETQQPKGEIFKWYWDNDYLYSKVINYKSYIKGLRIKDLE